MSHPGWLRPGVLDRIDLRVGTVIEASAGTGKTFLLENLVLELLVTGRARLDEILIVTFTERATAELRSRVGSKVAQALRAFDSPSSRATATGTTTATATGGWTLDQAARDRLYDANSRLDSASIFTIHGFCQRVLREDPFSTQRLLQQDQLDGRRLFSEVFRERLRRQFAIEPGYCDYLDTYLEAGKTIESMERLLYGAFQARGSWAHRYDEAALDASMRALVALDLAGAVVSAALRKMSSRKAAHMQRYLADAVGVANRCLADGTRAPLLAHMDRCERLADYLLELEVTGGSIAALQPLAACAHGLLDSAPSLEEAMAQKFLPCISTRIADRKLAEGGFDYDDMITSVADALDGATGEALTARIRERYRVALIDEAQDTEPAQWRIFRHCFLDSPGTNALVLVGDPKQAIYGFRGADVRTFLAACQDIVARGGIRITLSENFRSHSQVVDGYNAICDSSGPVPYFTGEVVYDAPVKAALGARVPATSAGVTLMTLDSSAGKQKIGRVRETMRAAIVEAIAELRASQISGPIALSEIFVLTRSNAESQEVADALRAVGIPNALYKPDDLFGTSEAEHVRTLIQAIADPGDRVARFQAWLTPFFDVPLAALARNPEPPVQHPAVARLRAWHQLSVEREYGQLWSGILRDSGVVGRLRLSPSSQRRLANYRQIFDVLLTETARSSKSLLDLAAWMTSLASQRRSARTETSDDPDVQRVETEAPSVQISTIHKAKGLEADCVFVYGALTRRNFFRGRVHVFRRHGERVLCAGVVRRPVISDLIAAEADEEDQRLFYVALTRARRWLFLPYASRLPSSSAAGSDLELADPHDDAPLAKLTGAYRVVNRRLEALAQQAPGEFLSLFSVMPCCSPPPGPAAAGGEGASENGNDDWRRRLARWRPPALDGSRIAVGGAPIDVAARRGFTLTSYSRVKETQGGYDAPAADPAPPHAPSALVGPVTSPLASPALAGGIESGLFLHSVLEKLALGILPPYELWRARADVQSVLQLELRRWARDPRQADAAARMVHEALTVSVTLPDGSVLPGLARARRIRREVDFLFPLPWARTDDPGSEVETGFVRGALDVIFEHEGRVYFADWKSDALPDFSPPGLARHVATNYELQIQLYSLALVRMLGIVDVAGYETRFGGFVYVFLRGLTIAAADGGAASTGAGPTMSPRRHGQPGLFVERPSWADLQTWDAHLPRLLTVDARLDDA